MRLGGRALVWLLGDAVLPAGLPLSQTAGETSYSCLPLFFFFFAWKLLSALQLDVNLLCLKGASVRSFGVEVRQDLRDRSRQIPLLIKLTSH